MSKILELTINDISKGWSPTEYLSADGQFLSSVAIDIEQPLADGGSRTSGAIRPVAYEKFSSTEINSHPIKFITTPKTTYIYVVLANGKLIRYNSDYTSPTELADYGSANGAFYYNDYIYVIDTTNVNRYGQLSGTPTSSTGVWTGATLGSLTALTNTTYPTIHSTSGNYPNHWGHIHGDDKAYFLDFKDGQGMIHFIKTTSTGTNAGSTYDALDLPFNYYPTCITSSGYDIAVGAIQTINNTLIQGTSSVLFWDTVSESFDRSVPIPGILTSLFNIKGVVYAISGSVSGKGGHTLYYYSGENTFKELSVVPEGFPPLPGAVDAVNNRLIWGTNTSDPVSTCHLMSYGSKDGLLPNGLHSVGRSTLTSTSTDGVITAVKWALQGTFAQPIVLMGGKNATSFEFYLEKPSTTYQNSIFRSKVFNVGQNFTVKNISLSLGGTLGSNMSIVPKLYIDDKTKTSTCKTVSLANYPDTSKNRNIKIYPETSTTGQNNFFLELSFTGTALIPVLLPIKIQIEVND